MTTRRGFLASILAAGVAPAFVGSSVLMPVRKIVAPEIWVPSKADPLGQRGYINAQLYKFAVIENAKYMRPDAVWRGSDNVLHYGLQRRIA